MRTLESVRAKALTPPMVSGQHNFLDGFYEPTQEMLEWYYGGPFVESVVASNVDEHTMVVGIIETSGDKRIHRSFTIGRSIKVLICKNYLFYHPMENR